MALWKNFGRQAILARGLRVEIAAPRFRDYMKWRDLRARSAPILKKREPVWEAEALSVPEFRRYVRAYERGARLGLAYAFFIWHQSEHKLLGACHLTHIRRGPAQMGSLGYWLGTDFHGQGYMREAVGLVCDYALSELGLHRIEAACMPDNQSSRHLLLNNSFVEEGYATAYLKINGQWEDHILFGLSRKEQRP